MYAYFIKALVIIVKRSNQTFKLNIKTVIDFDNNNDVHQN